MQPGQVVLVQTEGGYVLHRVSQVHGDIFRTRGDAHLHDEGPFTREQVVALVDARVRAQKCQPVRTGL